MDSIPILFTYLIVPSVPFLQVSNVHVAQWCRDRYAVVEEGCRGSSHCS